jgi:hypothetical protein
MKIGTKMNFNDSFKKIGEDIYVFKNFLSVEETKYLTDFVSKISEENWFGKYSIGFNETKIIRDRIIENIDPSYSLGETECFARLKRGETHGQHSDNHDFLDIRKASQSLIEGQPFDLVPDNKYGIVVYLNNFDGGELRYINQNIIYKPEAGEMVIHSAEENCMHEVLPVKSDYRYIHPNFLYQRIKVPR